MLLLEVQYHSIGPDVYSICDRMMLMILDSDDQSLGINNQADKVSKTERFAINYGYNLETWYFHWPFIFHRVQKEHEFV